MLKINGRSADMMVREITKLMNILEVELMKFKSEIINQKKQILFLNEEIQKIKNKELENIF